jgi:hypothetical protein
MIFRRGIGFLGMGGGEARNHRRHPRPTCGENQLPPASIPIDWYSHLACRRRITWRATDGDATFIMPADPGGGQSRRTEDGGDGGIRTLDRALQPYNGLANRRLQPLGHISGRADMPDAAVSRKRQIWGRRASWWPTTLPRPKLDPEQREPVFRIDHDPI